MKGGLKKMKIIRKLIVFLVVIVLVVGLLPTNAFAVKPVRKVYVRTDIEAYPYDGNYGSRSTERTAIPMFFSFAAQAVAVVQSVLAAASSKV